MAEIGYIGIDNNLISHVGGQKARQFDYDGMTPADEAYLFLGHKLSHQSIGHVVLIQDRQYLLVGGLEALEHRGVDCIRTSD